MMPSNAMAWVVSSTDRNSKKAKFFFDDIGEMMKFMPGA